MCHNFLIRLLPPPDNRGLLPDPKETGTHGEGALQHAVAARPLSGPEFGGNGGRSILGV